MVLVLAPFFLRPPKPPLLIPSLILKRWMKSWHSVDCKFLEKGKFPSCCWKKYLNPGILQPRAVVSNTYFVARDFVSEGWLARLFPFLWRFELTKEKSLKKLAVKRHVQLFSILNKIISKICSFGANTFYYIFLQEQEEGKDEDKVTFELEEPAEPTPTTGQRILATVQYFKTRLADLFVHFVILPDSKLRLIKYINCLFVFATTLSITYMVGNKIARKKR